MQVQPQEKLCIAALISDPFDTNQYYVQAVMRDTLTNKVLGSIKLTQDPNNSRRFFGYIEAPSNNTPTGRYINVVTSIYTDPAYSVYSQTYEEVVQSYIVAQRWSWSLAGGAGGVDLYAPNVGAIIRKELGDILGPVFKNLNKTVQGSRKSVRVKADTESASKIIEAVEASHAAIRADMKGDRSFKKLESALSEVLTKIDSTAGSSEDVKAALQKSLSKISNVAELIVGAYLSHQLGSTSFPQALPPEAPEEDPLASQYQQDGLPQQEEGSSDRRPSPGVVPVHVLARNRKALKSLTPTA